MKIFWVFSKKGVDELINFSRLYFLGYGCDEKKAKSAIAEGRTSSRRFEEKITKIEILWLTALRGEINISNPK